MPGGAKKHRSLHHFGRTRKKGRGRKRAGAATALREHVMDNRAPTSPDNAVVPEDASPDSVQDVESGRASINTDVISEEVREIGSPDGMRSVDLGHARMSTDLIGNREAHEVASSDSVRCVDSGRVHISFDAIGDREVREALAREKTALQRLSSIPATARKVEPFAEASNATTAPVPDQRAAPYVIMNIDSLSSLLQVLRCETCNQPARIVRGDSDYGLAVKLIVVCDNCGDIATEWSSPRVDGSKTCNAFDVNLLATRIMVSTGNGQTAMNDIFAAMGVSHRGMHHKTFQRHLKQSLAPAATQVAEVAMSQCAQKVATLYEDLCFGHRGNIAVSYDGSWMTRGHSSHLCVGAVIELFSGYVLDYVVLSNFCLGCEVGPKPDSEGYAEWKATHQCQKNSDSKAGHMEVEAGLILFRRSLERHGLHYTTILCDGDSRTFTAIQEAKVYGFIDVQKEDCVNHVQKRMGTALRNLVQKQKGEGKRSLGGRGRLTNDLIMRLSTYYGWALKSNDGDVDAMQKAVMATYRHVTSTDEHSDHSLCPTGDNSWCRQNAARAKGEPEPGHHYNLPKDVAEAMLPVYTRLSERTLLQRCQRGKTQNANESLHSVIWSLVSKEQHSSLVAVQAAVAEAVLRFNTGNLHASSAILQQLDTNITSSGFQRVREKDLRRSASSKKKREASLEVRKQAKKRHRDGIHPDYAPGAFP
ncbi:uncharacterized protein LOC144104115 [Amblyomma americanum]